MTKIPLRAYNREIEEAIEQKQIEEAIAHCRHILKTFPKHINTYRLLGKAFLESQRYSNAVDIFQRLLSSIPDDFISHVGMSIIREDEGNLDAAIWHMERAFESQPYNSAIQGELRRLYGQRDGMEPPKIRMTRGALARMYAKSDLYDQAIAEIRSNLTEDPQRADLQVLLAQMYTKNGQPTEAIEVCGSLLQRFPFCLEANRILAELLSEGERPDEMKTYRQRIQTIDPYEAFVSSRTPSVDDVHDQAVTLTRLDWDGGLMIPEISQQPEWATSIGVSLQETETDEEELPRWLAHTPGESDDPDLDEAEEVDSASIPGWMREAGWEPSSGDFEESESSLVFDEDKDESTGAQAGEVPDWLQEMAPKDIFDDDLEADGPSMDDLPSWLDAEADGASDTIINWLDDKEKSVPQGETKPSLDDTPSTPLSTASISPAETGEIPDWLQEMGDIPSETGTQSKEKRDALDDVIFDPSETSLKDDTIQEDIPDWLSELDSTDSDPADTPDWLINTLDVEASQELEPATSILSLSDESNEEQTIIEAATEAHSSDVKETASEPRDILPEWTEVLGAETSKDESDEIPEWPKGMEDQVREGELPSAGLEETQSDEMPSWLQGLEAKAAESKPPEPAATNKLGQPDEIPDWLQGLESEDVDSDTRANAPTRKLAEPEGIPDWLQGAEPEAPSAETASVTPAGDLEEEEIPDWLQEFEAVEEPVSETSPESPTDELVEAEPAEIPDWLQEFEAVEEPVSEALSETPADELAEAEPAEIPDWLQEFEGVEEPVSEALPETPADELVEAESVEVPDWLQEFEAVEEPVSETSPESPADELAEAEPAEIPDWLQEFEAVEEPVSETSPESPTDELVEAEPAEIPDWLQKFETVEEPVSEALSETPADELEEAEPVEVPDWLQEFETVEEPVSEALSETPADELAEAEPAEIPDWLQEFETVEEPVSEALSETPADELEEAEPAEIPDWLQKFETVEEPVSEALSETPADELAEAEPAEIPDWLEEFEAVEEPVSETSPETPADELVEAEPTEIPDWLQEFDVAEPLIEMPPEIPASEMEKAKYSAVVPSEELSEAESAEIPVWLQGLGEGDEATQIVQPDEMADDESVEIPDWLGDIEKDITSKTPPSGVTGWLNNIDEEELDKMVIDYQPGELPDWLENIVDERKAEETKADQSVEILSDEDEARDATLISEEVESTPEPEMAIPDWLQETDEPDAAQPVDTESISEPVSESVMEEPTPIEEQFQPDIDFEDADAAMAWLEGLAAKQGVSEDELISRPEDRPDTLPDSLQEGTETLAEEISAEELEEVPGLPTEQPEVEEWDTTLISEEVEPIPEPEMAIPDWLQETDEPDAAQPVDTESIPEPVSESVMEEPAPTEEQLQSDIDFEDADAAMAWLEGLAAKQGVSEDELISRPEDRPETPPDSLQEGTETPAEEISAEELEEVPGLPTQQPEVEAWDTTLISEEVEPIPEPEMAIPDYLQETDEPDAAQPVDTESIPEPVSESVMEEPAPTEEQLQSDIDFEDADAAMAWLEGLAAKQGVSEDELISRPEDRSEKPPDWVQQEIEPLVTEDATEVSDWVLADSPMEEELLEPEEPSPVKEAVESTIYPQESDFSKDIPEFLREALNAEAIQDESAIDIKDEETEPLEPVADTLQIETPTDELPDWLEQAQGDETDSEEILEITQEAPLEDIPEWLRESVEEEPDEISEEMEGEKDTVEALIEPESEVHPIKIDAPVESPVVEVESGTPAPADEKEEAGDELEIEPPSWVLSGDAPEDDTYQWLPTEPQEEGTETGKLLDLNEASMIQLERLSGLGFRRAQAIIAHRDEHGPFDSLSDLLSVPGMDEETIQTLESDLSVSPSQIHIPIPERPTLEPAVEIEPEDEDHAQQLEALSDLTAGNLEEAIFKYENLIQAGKNLDQVITDLDQALSTDFPNDVYVDLLQTLGDAYLKADRLQDALDSYTKAEELLR